MVSRSSHCSAKNLQPRFIGMKGSVGSGVGWARHVSARAASTVGPVQGGTDLAGARARMVVSSTRPCRRRSSVTHRRAFS